ncbi:adenosine deaminase [Clostridium carboxidivorans P7]|uniref:Adenosine deaminase n=1 Tax=Clostridium carboxidivorans P7 TaxID=536227 RepID=C6PR51_9CLOT|nr:adenosine deaminase [Clostridium carboxidivorans]AKN29549.1 adenosine deaminase [Clostridium carboxidivorans P7]EET88275.1 adenosine deaminase [Clostridium carboxidivorans P7]EFG89525.1 adenosine deaminase [Clostridium carboxidivorans P7]
MDYNKIIKNLPKVDLHCHLDGSLRPQTIIDIAVKENIDIPTKELKEFEKYVKVFGECDSLKDYLDKFELPIKVMQNKKNIYRITSELLEDVSKDNVKYIEIRFAPFNHIQKGLKAEDVIEAAIEAMKDGRKKYGVMSNLILCAMRHESVESSKRLVEIGKKYLGKGVAAVDLAGNEHDFPPEIHKEAFDLAQKYGFHCTIHAGETGIEQNIIKSIEMLHAERIGHGVYAFKDEKVVKYLKDRQIPLEMCITSNIDTKAVKDYEFHPIKKYLDEGLVVTVNTDNMTVSNVSLNDEFNHLVKEQNFTLEDIKKVVKNGIEASFASEDDKDILRKQYEKALEIL